jgi:hypothetical protein
MIAHQESSAYRPSSLAHASSTSTTPDQWLPSRSATSSAIPPPREPATSARGAPPSVFRHHSTPAHAHALHPPATSSTSTSIPIPPYDQSSTASPAPSGTVSTSSTSSSLPAASDAHASPTRAKRASEDNTPPILLRDLNHVVELAKEDRSRAQTSPARRSRGYEDKRRYEISSMPVSDVIEMVAALLTKITTTNDRQHEHLHRNIPPPDTVGMSTTTNSVLAFHGKNVPSITILSYLSRIHKYCPTTYEVFLSLLVYFDRMTERVNKKHMQGVGGGTVSTAENGPEASPAPVEPYHHHSSHVFVVDSYNIHRLVIAGVTCASKFFSDVFYTNSRYAKVCSVPPFPLPISLSTNWGKQVGGLPLAELNHLELQFLILNDFRLSVPVEELEAYGTMLVQFYAREAIANCNLHPIASPPPPPATQTPTPTQQYGEQVKAAVPA